MVVKPEVYNKKSTRAGRLTNNNCESAPIIPGTGEGVKKPMA
jgi:hypothetical protein